MKSKYLHCAYAAAVVASVCSIAAAPAAPQLQSGVLQQNFDKAVRPQDDFYRYVNGQWLTATAIPSDRSNYGAFALLEEGAEKNLREILEEASTRTNVAAGSDQQKLGDFYASFMDEAAIEARGLQPLAQEFGSIDALKSVADVVRYIGHAQRIGVPHPFAFYVAIDEKHSTQYLGTVTQTGLTMPDRDYYLSDDARLKGVREKYRAYVRDLLTAANTPDAAGAAEKIVALETRLATAQWTRVQNRDAEKTYNRHDRKELAQLTPGLDWAVFFDGAGVPASKVGAINVAQPSYFSALAKTFAEVPVAHWRTYLRFKVLNAFAADLPARFVKLNFDFNQGVISGIERIKPRWKRGVDTVEGSAGELAGKAYVERYFSSAAKGRMDALVDNLKAAYSQGIDQLEWMSPATKAKAHAKLALFTTKIGYPSKWRDYSALQVKRDDLIGNEMRAADVAFERNVRKLGGPIDKTEWLMTPQTVNAYYNPPANEIVFPAAILQPPFFNVQADDAVNYGGIGAVIGHEMSHGFDDQGRRYDGAGNLNDWWAAQDNEEFSLRAKALGAQYDALSPFAGLHVNGELTMGENIADLGGVAMAYRAYKLSLNGKQAPVIDGFTGDQRFFIGWAQVWVRNYRDDELKKRLLTDPHSPSEYRANNILSNMPQFYAAFGVKPGDKMYRAAAEQVRIW
jgi:predicted metalloendopeptidase